MFLFLVWFCFWCLVGRGGVGHLMHVRILAMTSSHSTGPGRYDPVRKLIGQVADGLEKIYRCGLPGKFKAWLYQHALPRGAM